MPPSLQDTKSHQGFIKITLVEFGVSVNWWQLFHFNLPKQKVSGKYFKTKAVE